jgi:hypothetical protein
MSKGQLALELVKTWVDKIGPSEAKRRLYKGGMSYSAADQIVRGSYHCTPGYRLAKIILSEIGYEDSGPVGGQAS